MARKYGRDLAESESEYNLVTWKKVTEPAEIRQRLQASSIMSQWNNGHGMEVSRSFITLVSSIICTLTGGGDTLWMPQSSIQRRQWHPTPVLLPGKSHGWRSLVGCSPWGRKESDTTERLHFHFSLSCIREGNGNPLQCSCLENPRDGGAWWVAVYGVSQNRTRLKWLSSSNWRIIAVQYCAGFCHTLAWIGHRYTYAPSLLNPLPPPTPSPPSRL